MSGIERKIHVPVPQVAQDRFSQEKTSDHSEPGAVLDLGSRDAKEHLQAGDGAQARLELLTSSEANQASEPQVQVLPGRRGLQIGLDRLQDFVNEALRNEALRNEALKNEALKNEALKNEALPNSANPPKSELD